MQNKAVRKFLAALFFGKSKKIKIADFINLQFNY